MTRGPLQNDYFNNLHNYAHVPLCYSFAYILEPNSTSIAVLSLDAPGNATLVQDYNWSSIATNGGLSFGTSGPLSFHDNIAWLTECLSLLSSQTLSILLG